MYFYILCQGAFSKKNPYTRDKIRCPNFLFKILQAVCLGFVHIPDIGPVPFQIIEQKLVQRYETHIDAKSCKASYLMTKALDVCLKVLLVVELQISPGLQVLQTNTEIFKGSIFG